MSPNNPRVLGAKGGVVISGEAILAEQKNTMFASLRSFNLPNVKIVTGAVASVRVGGCVGSLALDPSATPAIKFNGTSDVFTGCGFAADSTNPKSVDFTGTTQVNAAWFSTAGSYKAGPNATIPTIETNASVVSDPFSCYPPRVGCTGPINYTLPPASAAITTNGSQLSTGTVILQPGLSSTRSK